MNTIAKSLYFSVATVAAVFVFAVSTPVASAQDFDGGCDFCGGWDNYSSGGWEDFSSGGWDGYSGGGWDNYASDGWDNFASDGWDNFASDGWDNFASDGWDNFASDGWDNFASDGWDNFASDGWDNFSSDGWDNFASGGWDDAYDCDYGCYTDEYGVDYFYDESFSGGGNYGQSTPRTTPGCTSCGGSRSTPPITVRNPSYTTPSYPSYPSYPPQRPQPQPQPYVYNYPSSNTNVNTITNTNTNVNNVDNSNNSINNSFNSSVARVTPVSSYPVQYPVQYTFPPTYVPTPTYQNTYCTLTASPSYIQNGQASYLSWTSYGATSAWLSDGIGMVAPNGTLAVRPNGSMTYTLTVSGFGGTRTCQTYVNVSGQYVALSQIPYTGFDLGTFGNAMYWLGLLSFAAAASYLVLYYKGGASIFLPSMLGGVRLPKLKRIGGAVASPVMFSNTKVGSHAERSATIEDLPVMNSMSAPKDSMAVKASSAGECPRIVISRG